MKLWISTAIFVILLVLGWFGRDQLSAWVRDKAIQGYVSQIEPYLPFKIDDVTLGSSIAEVMKGNGSELKLKLRVPGSGAWPETRFTLEGWFQVKFLSSESLIEFQYAPKTIAEINGGASDPLLLRIKLRLHRTELSVKFIEVKIDSEKWTWKTVGLELDKIRFVALWQENQLTVDSTMGSFGVERGEESTYIGGVALNASAAVSLSPMELTGSVYSRISLNSLERIVGDSYTDIPVKGFIATAESQDGFKTASIQLAHEKKTWVKGSFQAPDRFEGELRAIPVSQLLELAKPWVSLPQDLVVRSGTMEGRWWISSDSHAFKAKAAIRGLSAAFGDDIEVKKIETEWFLSSSDTGYGVIKPFRFRFKKIIGDTGELRLLTEPLQSLTESGWELNARADSEWFWDFSEIGELGFSAIEFKAGNGSEKLSFKLYSSAIHLDLMSAAVCSDWVPALAKLEIALDPVSMNASSVETKGSIQAQLFDGKIEIKSVRAFRVFDSVPEFQFDADWWGLDLASIGEWLGFGEMDGEVFGYAHGVTLQAALPTQYDFFIKAVPKKASRIVFSPDAMKNTVRLFAGEDLENSLPGIANWMAFGWPSRFFGGYNVDYAGFSAYSQDGAIVVSTLDPPEVYERERKRFMLYGPRFKIPIQGSRYPIVLDTAGMANLVRRISQQVSEIKNEPKNPDGSSRSGSKEGLSHEKISLCAPDHF